jgi:ankyrin repeat protein
MRELNFNRLREMLAANPTLKDKPLTNHSDKITPLGLAILLNSKPLLDFLIENGADLNKQFKFFTPLIYAIEKGNTRLFNTLLDAGANINAESTDHKTPLMYSIIKNDIGLINHVLSKGADVNIVKDGITPLYIAINNVLYSPDKTVLSDKDKRIISILKDAGADPNILVLSRSPLFSFIMNFYDRFATDYYGQLAEFMLEKFPTINVNLTASTRTNKPIFIAVQYFNADLVNKILDNPTVDINAKSIYHNKTILHDFASYDVDFTNNDTKETVLFLINKALDKGAQINEKDALNYTPLHYATLRDILPVVQLLVERGATITHEIIALARSDAVRNYLMEHAPANARPQMWKGFTKSDITKFDTIFDDANPNAIRNVSCCPVCLKYIERSEACNYMKHDCSLQGYYHKMLFDKYKNDENKVTWCTICGRICFGHRHYRLGAWNDPKPELITDNNPFAPDCSVTAGGGGPPEKIMRFRTMRQYAAVLQREIDRIKDDDARNELVEAMWLPPSLPRVSKQILNTKRFNNNISVFANNAVNVPVPAAPVVAGPPPGSFNPPEILPASVDNPNSISYDDDLPVIRFIHKSEAGEMYRHNIIVNKNTVLNFIKLSGPQQNRCFEPECNGKFWPEEIEAAFAEPLIAPSITDEDRVQLNNYKERFYRNFVGGGSAAKLALPPNAFGGASNTLNVFQPATDAECALPTHKRGGSGPSRAGGPNAFGGKKSRRRNKKINTRTRKNLKKYERQH